MSNALSRRLFVSCLFSPFALLAPALPSYQPLICFRRWCVPSVRAAGGPQVQQDGPRQHPRNSARSGRKHEHVLRAVFLPRHMDGDQQVPARVSVRPAAERCLGRLGRLSRPAAPQHRKQFFFLRAVPRFLCSTHRKTRWARYVRTERNLLP